MKFFALKQGNVVTITPKDLAEELSDGEYAVDLRRPRNYKFLKKYFALLNAAYSLWDTPEGVERSRDSFREEVIIKAGYFEHVFSIDGTFKLKAKSISFAKMEEPEFEQLYSKTIDVILWHVLPTYDRETLLKMEDEILRFV